MAMPGRSAQFSVRLIAAVLKAGELQVGISKGKAWYQIEYREISGRAIHIINPDGYKSFYTLVVSPEET
jgi:hypothetical protein